MDEVLLVDSSKAKTFSMSYCGLYFDVSPCLMLTLLPHDLNLLDMLKGMIGIEKALNLTELSRM